MPVQTQIICPNCRQPLRAAIDQLFDATADPADKQRFLSGQFNLIQCPNCRYQGTVASPIVYHDADKQLLLTFFPIELAMPKPEQEKLVGRLVNQVMSKLPPEKRKGYLLNPVQVLTLQGMIEKVLEGEGITREMLAEQRKKSDLLQELLRASGEALPELIRKHDEDIDETFFRLLSLSASANAGRVDPRIAERLSALQAQLLDHSSFGRDLRAQQENLEQAVKLLEQAGDQLTREQFMEMVVNAPNEDQALALVSLARQAVDYSFFQLLTRRMEQAGEDEKARLSALRDKILDVTREMDAAAEAHAREAGEVLKALLQAEDPQALLPELLPQIDDTFLAVLSANLQAAEQSGRKELAGRLAAIGDAVMAAMAQAAPPEIRFINELLAQKTEKEAADYIRSQLTELDQSYFDAMTYVAEDLRKNGQVRTAERVEELHSLAMREAMASRLRS